MPLLASLKTRNRQPEVMDQPDIEPERFIGALVGLRRVNIATQTTRLLWPDIEAAARRHPGRQLRVLDVGSGGGDVLVGLWRRAKRAGLDIAFDGCDISPLAIAHAKAHIKRSGADGSVNIFALDVLKDALPEGYDVITTTLFLHHLPEQDAISFLRDASAKAKDRVVIQDLTRGAIGYLFAKYGVMFLLCNDVCRIDGPRSVEGAFTVDEAADLARRAGLENTQVVAKFPFRFMLRWIRPLDAASASSSTRSADKHRGGDLTATNSDNGPS